MGQFEWETSNLHISYPFERPGAGTLNSAFAGALVLDTDQGARVGISSISITDWTPAAVSIDVTYSDSTAFFASAPVVTIEAYGEWQLISMTDANKVVQLLVNGSQALPITTATRLNFVARVHECDPKAVESIEVTDGVTSFTYILTGDVTLNGGYNVLLQQTNEAYTDRDGAASVTLSAIPGIGLGVAPGSCDPELALRSINTIGPDEFGHFVLNALDCYRAVVPTTGSPYPAIFDPTPAAIKVYNDCVQCCTCEDYENTYRGLARLHNKGSNTGLRLSRVIDNFKSMKDTISSQKDLRNIPSMDLLLRPTPGYILGIQINLMNNRTLTDLLMNKSDIDDVLVKMLITSSDVAMSGATVLPSTCYLFNSAYGNPWLRVAKTDVLLEPISFTDPVGVGIIIKAGLVSGKDYHVIKTTQFVSIFFEMFWQDSVSPAPEDEISVKLTSSVFKPYTLTKVDELIAPFDGTV